MAASTEQPSPIDAHLNFVSARMTAGKIIPFLGAGANLCGRPAGADWLNDHFLPTGDELAAYLAAGHPHLVAERGDLSRISQYVDLFGGGEAVLFEKLRALFAGEYYPNALHRFLAAIPGAMRADDVPDPCQFIITTNYDDALERAFADAGEAIDVVYYAASRGKPGRFVHVHPDGKRVPVPKTYRGFALGERTVLLKIHGAVDRAHERKTATSSPRTTTSTTSRGRMSTT